MRLNAQVPRTLRTLALACALLTSGACGRLGFSERDESVRQGDARDVDALDDASVAPFLGDAGLATPLDASSDAGRSKADAAAPAQDAMPSDTGSPEAGSADASADDAGRTDSGIGVVVDPACNADFPIRLWPIASDAQSCTDSVGITRSATGPGSADYTIFNGCSSWLEFRTTVGSPIEIRAFGDGCVCTDCDLWHVHYQLEENLGQGREPVAEIEMPDSTMCPNGMEVDTLVSYAPRTTRVRMQTLAGSTGSGFYFVVCGVP